LTLKSQAHTKMFHALHPYVYKEAHAQVAIILHLEAKYAKNDYKNEIYMKNWVGRT